MATTPLTNRLADDLDRWFPDLVRTVQDGLFSGALRMIGDRAEAEDVAQEALIRAYQALTGYPPDRIRELRLEAWIWTIAANLCRNRLRSRARRPTEPLSDRDRPEPGGGPEEQALDGERRDRLCTHLARLPWPMRSAVVLRHVVGLSYRQIAAALDRPEGTAKADVHRGLSRLRAAISEEEIR